MQLCRSVLLIFLGIITSFTIILLLTRAHENENLRAANTSLPLQLSVPIGSKNTSLSQDINQIPLSKAINTTSRFCHGKKIEVNENNIFLVYAMCAISHGSDIVHFSGPKISQLFDTNNNDMHVYTGHDMNTKYWGDVTELIKKVSQQKKENNMKTKNQTQDIAVHLHNYHKLGDFLMLFRNEYFRSSPEKEKYSEAGPQAVPLTPQQFNWAIDRGQAPVVITNWGDENWGAFSGAISTRTAKWLNMTNHLLIHHSNYHTVRMLLDSPKVVLVTTNTHVAPGISNHTKLICLPLGMKNREQVYRKGLRLLSNSYNKTKLLRINNSGWGDRAKINKQVSALFNNSVQNSYSRHSKADHHLDTALAKFTLCPSGLGFDTYRLWETLLLGSIPIVESNAGLDRAYSHLPVLVVHNYAHLTPVLLDTAYKCFVKHAHLYKYQHLTEKYWIELVRTAVRTGLHDHISIQHPFRNKYCDFL